MEQYGLIGYPLGHSFSKRYFTEKFLNEGIAATYELYELPDLAEFGTLLSNSALSGLNVTIPYKEAIIPFLDELDETAQKVGAVNTIRFLSDGRLKGYNTDVIGFEQTLKPLLKPYHTNALVLGTGGASKAVTYVLKRLGINFKLVSRTKTAERLCYADLSQSLIESHLLIVNTTPIGMHPNINAQPPIPYQFLSNRHLLYDLVYNPLQTKFLSNGKAVGATTQNGLAMLEAQAEASYQIWKEKAVRKFESEKV